MPDKRRVAGTVDRIEGNAVVVVFKDPDSGDTREAVVNKMKLKRVELKEGDPVTVALSVMETKPTVTVGSASKKKAENPVDELVEFARHERETRQSVELRTFAKKHKYFSDTGRIKQMEDKDIDLTDPDAAELDESFLDRAVVELPKLKKVVKRARAA